MNQKPQNNHNRILTDGFVLLSIFLAIVTGLLILYAGIQGVVWDPISRPWPLVITGMLIISAFMSANEDAPRADFFEPVPNRSRSPRNGKTINLNLRELGIELTIDITPMQPHCLGLMA